VATSCTLATVTGTSGSEAGDVEGELVVDAAGLLAVGVDDGAAPPSAAVLQPASINEPATMVTERRRRMVDSHPGMSAVLPYSNAE
jgi:hypothetical protein